MEKCENIPEIYGKIFSLKGLNINDFWLKRTAKDGLCGAHAVVQHAHLEEGVVEAMMVRRNINLKLVSNWEEYEEDFPFDKKGDGDHIETVRMETKEFNNREDYKNFLRSKDSEEMWMTQTCLQVVADMYQAKVHTLETNVVQGRIRKGATELEKEGARVKARWTVTIPNPNFENQGEFVDQVQDFFLLNSSLTHYDLMVHRESKLAEFGLLKKLNKTSENKVESTQAVENESESEDEDQQIICNGPEPGYCLNCPISKANTLEEEYNIVKLELVKLRRIIENDKIEREEEDKRMGGKVTASKFRADIRKLKADYADAMKVMAEEVNAKKG